MTDVEQLQHWMDAHGHSKGSLARDIGIGYYGIYQMIEVRKAVSDKFIIQFIKRYGCDEALRVFATRLQPTRSS